MQPTNLDHLEKLLSEQKWARDWDHDIVPPGKPAHKLACEAIRALPTLIAEIHQLREGLEPFSSAFDGWDGEPETGDLWEHPTAMEITLGDLRRARALLSSTPAKIVGGWQPIETAPRDGTYILLGFDGPFNDSKCPGAAVGKSVDRGTGWWLTAIWAATMAHRDPVRWMPIPAPQGKMEADRG